MLIKKINKIPDSIFNSLNLAVHDKSIEHNTNLAGNIEQEYKLDKYISMLEKYLLDEIGNDSGLMDYMNTNFNCNTENRLLSLTSLWVNFQKKHEFNPVHNHDGVFSFIIFIKVPFLRKEQKKISPGKKSNFECAGFLEFLYSGFLGNIETIKYPVDKTWEQKMLIFPAKLSHCVYPFYGTDEYRITMSGNVKFKL
jgi:hypothetical protein|tara:strand:- start:2589 stop:3176 length:588 start_codon:yes stop_codon:yes gene_type:complete